MADPTQEKQTVSEIRNGTTHFTKVVRSIPRRRQVAEHRFLDDDPNARREKFQTSPLAIIKSLFVWAWALTYFMFRNFLDSITFRGSRERNAVRLRELLQRMGTTAIKLGQQLSLRADILPGQYCNELRKLLDSVPPFPYKQAVRLIEQETGRKLDDIFSEFDPNPIGSASISCVYQAILKNGDKVAVKVRRPGIGERLSADLRALIWISRIVEGLGITRPGLADLPMRELERMLLTELDFRQEARYTEIFRKDSKDLKYLSAPKVYFHLSTSKIIVSEFVSGVFLSELLRVVDSRDVETLVKFQGRGFDLEKISKRMMRVFFWEIFQGLFFHADPHPANIIIRPDNTIIMIDFGSCGEISRSYRRDLLNFYRHLEQADLHGVVRSMISSLEPLPPIDVEAYSNDLLAIVRDSFIAIQSEHSSWEEKCAGGMWMRLINLHREYDIPTPPDVLRFFRASFLYDSIIYRLNPAFNQINEFSKWYEKWGAKVKKRMVKEWKKRIFGLRNGDFLQLEHILSITEQGMERMQRFLNRPDYDYVKRVDKLAYAISMTIKTIVQGAFFLILLGLIHFFYLVGSSQISIMQEDGLWRSMLFILRQPMVHFFLFIMTLIVIRKILMRMDDVDVRD